MSASPRLLESLMWGDLIIFTDLRASHWCDPKTQPSGKERGLPFCPLLSQPQTPCRRGLFPPCSCTCPQQLETCPPSMKQVRNKNVAFWVLASFPQRKAGESHPVVHLFTAERSSTMRLHVPRGASRRTLEWFPVFGKYEKICCKHCTQVFVGTYVFHFF